MEYLSLGNLAEQHGISRITEWETVTLCQGLDALDYLHSRKIVHRDLKPENVPVQCREPANFYIKIADFGLAKNDSFLVTFCGTQLYAAPEIWENSPYTAKVDIWSLGLITFQYSYGLPKVPKVKGKFHPERWYRKLVRAIDDWGSYELINFLKSSMLRTDPHQRLSASERPEESPKLREAITPAQIFENDLGTPTEKMSSSVIMAAEASSECSRMVDPRLILGPCTVSKTFVGNWVEAQRWGFQCVDVSNALCQNLFLGRTQLPAGFVHLHLIYNPHRSEGSISV